MVNSVENNLVPNQGLNVGVLNPPQELYKPELYNAKQADAQFKQLTQDIYEKEHSKSFEELKKTPVSVLFALGAAALGGGYFVFKKIMKWKM